MNQSTFKAHFPDIQLQPSTIQIRAYNKELVPVIGEAIVKVEYKNIIQHLAIYIVPSGLDSICGRKISSQYI